MISRYSSKVASLQKQLQQSKEAQQDQRLKVAAAETAQRGFKIELQQLRFEAEILKLDNKYFETRVKLAKPVPGLRTGEAYRGAAGREQS